MMCEDWQRIPFAEAVQISPHVELERGTMYPFVSMQAVTPGRREVEADGLRIFKGGGSRFEDSDTLMARITPCLENGKIARFAVRDAQRMAHGSTEFIVIRGRSGVTDSRFVYYLTTSAEVRAFAISQMSGTSGRQRVPSDSLHHLLVDIPPLPEQRRIAHILGTLDDKIELNWQMNRTLEAIARAIFKSWFIDFDPVIDNAILNGKPIPDKFAARAAVRRKILARNNKGMAGYRHLFPDSFQDSPLGKIPKGWEVAKLGKIFSLEYGKALKASIRRPGDVPVYGSNGQVGWYDENLVDGPGIVVGRKGNPGTVTWVHGDFFPIDTTFYVVQKDPSVSMHFLFHALEAENLPSLAADSAVPGLNRNIAYENRLLLPEMAVLDRFETTCAALQSRIQLREMESRTLIQTRDVLLPKLMAGKLSTGFTLKGVEP